MRRRKTKSTEQVHYPNINDPLKFDYQYYTDAEQQSDLIRADGAKERMLLVDDDGA
jgi:hypothetical protein